MEPEPGYFALGAVRPGSGRLRPVFKVIIKRYPGLESVLAMLLHVYVLLLLDVLCSHIILSPWECNACHVSLASSRIHVLRHVAHSVHCILCFKVFLSGGLRPGTARLRTSPRECICACVGIRPCTSSRVQAPRCLCRGCGGMSERAPLSFSLSLSLSSLLFSSPLFSSLLPTYPLANPSA